MTNQLSEMIGMLGQFEAAYYGNQANDDSRAQGGLNGQDFVDKHLDFFPRFQKTAAYVIFHRGQSYHKLALVRDIVDHYLESMATNCSEIAYYSLLETPEPYESLRAAAVEQYELAIQLDPAMGAAHFNLASLAEERGDWPLAIDLYRKASGLDRVYAPHADWRIARISAQSGQTGTAAELFMKALNQMRFFDDEIEAANFFRNEGEIPHALDCYSALFEWGHNYLPEFYILPPPALTDQIGVCL